MILDDLVAVTKRRMQKEQAEITPAKMRELAVAAPKPDHAATLRALRRDGARMHVIAEVKKASPSKGLIAAAFDPVTIAKSYAVAGVNAISVLTEPDYFRGDIKYLAAIHQAVNLPLLRKDFTIDDYMIYQARANGASLILLIVAILSKEQLRDYLQLARELDLAAIVETHDETELQTALAAGAEIIGINNRDLRDFTVDLNNSVQLSKLVPADKIVIAESGIKTATAVQELAAGNIDACLIGEAFMRADDKKAELTKLFGKPVS
ncbi:indole-3-glycerol phosphate synthase TrpC [Lacticaseibacillus zhaodongensis]|uniref:indole-3-glycerol phosphate synthase TrpC n=1 Tax=Lacticaseibacillus zhaodongensis TaxID=2668065 RepID=UPI0012D31098|nr:indole-3-glycerol phosphate synthase TrpC [Lacticaseibacillus zhaodongensis]